VNPVFNYDAKVYDEKPLTFRASARQRLRWMQGHFDVARRYFFPLLWQGIKERSWAKIDTAIYAANVYNLFVSSIVSIILWIDVAFPGAPVFKSLFQVSPFLFMFVSVASYVQFPLALVIEKAPLKTWRYLLLYPVFLLSWWPITFYAFFTQNNKQWSHTKHTRVIRLEDVKTKQAS